MVEFRETLISTRRVHPDKLTEAIEELMSSSSPPTRLSIVKDGTTYLVRAYANTTDCPRCCAVVSEVFTVGGGVRKHTEDKVEGVTVVELDGRQDTVVCANCLFKALGVKPYH
jgi:hypothetical protein